MGVLTWPHEHTDFDQWAADPLYEVGDGLNADENVDLASRATFTAERQTGPKAYGTGTASVRLSFSTSNIASVKMDITSAHNR